MKRNLDTQVCNIDGTPAHHVDEDTGKKTEKLLTIGYVISTALGNARPNDKSLAVSVKRGRLAHQLFKGGVQEISTDELEEVKKACEGMNYSPSLLFQISDWIETNIPEPPVPPPSDLPAQPATPVVDPVAPVAPVAPAAVPGA